MGLCNSLATALTHAWLGTVGTKEQALDRPLVLPPTAPPCPGGDTLQYHPPQDPNEYGICKA